MNLILPSEEQTQVPAHDQEVEQAPGGGSPWLERPLGARNSK